MSSSNLICTLSHQGIKNICLVFMEYKRHGLKMWNKLPNHVWNDFEILLITFKAFPDPNPFSRFIFKNETQSGCCDQMPLVCPRVQGSETHWTTDIFPSLQKNSLCNRVTEAVSVSLITRAFYCSSQCKHSQVKSCCLHLRLVWTTTSVSASSHMFILLFDIPPTPHSPLCLYHNSAVNQTRINGHVTTPPPPPSSSYSHSDTNTHCYSKTN